MICSVVTAVMNGSRRGLSMGNCEEIKKDVEDFFKREGLLAKVVIKGCTENKTTLIIDLDVSIEINGVCVNPKKHRKNVTTE